MREQIRDLIKVELQEYGDTIAELTEQVDDLYRRLRNQLRVGICSEVDPKAAKVKVQHGDNTTPWIKWFALYAGEVKEYRCPSVGEQCLLLNYAAGDNSSQSFALFGLFSDQFPAPTADPNEILRVYPDGTRVSYNTESHKLAVTIEGEAQVNVAKSAQVDVGTSATVKAGGVVKVDGEKIHLNGGSPCVTTAHICHFTGNPHGDGSSTVTAGK